VEDLENKLRHSVVGQDEAIHQIVSAYQTFLAGLSPVGRPIGNFLFLGPTGLGKTRIVEATAQSLLNDPRAAIKIDCAEFQHGHEIAKLVARPPVTWDTVRRTLCYRKKRSISTTQIRSRSVLYSSMKSKKRPTHCGTFF